MKALLTTSLIGGLCLTGMVIAQDTTTQDTQTTAPTLTMSQAQEIALGQIAGQVVEAELETEDGTQVFEIEIAAADGTYSEVTIDAASGEILAKENNRRDDDDHDDDDDKECDDEKKDRKRS